MTIDNPPPDSLLQSSEGYWVESRQPWTSLVFIAPFLAVYEVGVLLLREQNGADVWMRELLKWMGFGPHFLLPILTVGILLGWHYITRRSWRISPRVLSTMGVECLLLAIVLRFLLHLQGSLMQTAAAPAAMSIGSKCKEAVGFLGAGIYEELLFRLILLSAVIWILARLKVAETPRIIAAVVLTSLLFSSAHYVGHLGDSFHWFSFLFRFLAGVYFSILFLYRGFGIAAGTHAMYDIMVGLF
jgi:membrane protease YdiL (CAAX protease family)